MATNWILIDARETIEEKSVTSGTLVSVYRRRVAHFTYQKRTAGDYSWGDHNSETQLAGGPTDTRCTDYGATINPITTSIAETKTLIDKTPWFFAYAYTIESIPGAE